MWAPMLMDNEPSRWRNAATALIAARPNGAIALCASPGRVTVVLVAGATREYLSPEDDDAAAREEVCRRADPGLRRVRYGDAVRQRRRGGGPAHRHRQLRHLRAGHPRPARLAQPERGA